jgi:hypothetical protein
MSTTSLAHCHEDYTTPFNAYNKTRSTICSPIGWEVFPTALPNQVFNPCFSTSQEPPSYLPGDPTSYENSSISFEEVLYVVLTASFKLKDPSVPPKNPIIGLSIGGGVWGLAGAVAVHEYASEGGARDG